MSNSLFHLNDNVDIDGLLNDFQHDVTATIERYKDETEFPHIHDFNITAGELDDYLFEKQAILDSNGTERSRYTLAGTLVVLPVVILAFFHRDSPFKNRKIKEKLATSSLSTTSRLFSVSWSSKVSIHLFPFLITLHVNFAKNK